MSKWTIDEYYYKVKKQKNKQNPGRCLPLPSPEPVMPAHAGRRDNSSEHGDVGWVVWDTEAEAWAVTAIPGGALQPAVLEMSLKGTWGFIYSETSEASP